MQTELIGMPLYYGCDNPGTERAYAHLLQAGLVQKITDTGIPVAQTTTVTIPPVTNKLAAPTLHYLAEIMESCHNLEQAVDGCLGRGHFPFILGGDHALGIGSIAGISRHCPKEDLTVIWVDAHTDINTDETSASHHIHGMPLAACLGLGDPRLHTGFQNKPPFLLPQNLFYLGARSVDPGEWACLEKLQIRCFTMQEIRTHGMAEAVRHLLSLVKTPWIHLSFDVDFIDAGEYTATGLPIPDGPSVADTRSALQAILADRRVRSMDFVEYSPAHDHDGMGLAICLDLVTSCFSVLAE